MIELVIGAALGALVSLMIAEVYHRRSSRDLNEIIGGLQEKNSTLGEMIANLEGWHELHYDDLQVIRKHSVVGTPDDPEYPYK
jgi:hypothetical protein